MKGIEFPIFKTKMEGDRKFDLSIPKEREEYLFFKAGEEIEEIRNFLKESAFIIYLLGKKSAGKGTYSKMLAEVIDPDKIDHFSIGDMVRDIDKELQDEKKKEELLNYLKRNYRGWNSLDEVMDILQGRSTTKLLPTDFILTLVKREIAKRGKKVIFIDGFPRNMDQISYSLFFRDLIGYRDDADFFVLIDVPEQVIDERVKWRKICPACNTSRNLKLLPTSKIEYDKENDEFHLLCDNPQCKEVRMVRKEGDEAGIDPIRERLEMDEKLIKQAFNLYGIPKILLRNSVPVDKAKEFVADYELTPEYNYKWNEKENKVEVIETPWTIKDDNGVESYSLMAPPVVVSFIKQLADILKTMD
jgi:adenylate kinase family enzyme